MLRVALGLIALSCALYGWWIPLLGISAILCLLYSAWEVIVIALLADLLWFPSSFHALPLATLCALALVWGLEPLRREFLPRHK